MKHIYGSNSNRNKVLFDTRQLFSWVMLAEIVYPWRRNYRLLLLQQTYITTRGMNFAVGHKAVGYSMYYKRDI